MKKLIRGWATAVCMIGMAMTIAGCNGGDDHPVRVGGSDDPACAALPAASSAGFEQKLEAYMNAFCYRSWQHDPTVRTSNGVHPWVKVFYSPAMFTWLQAGDRQANLADGAMLVKEQYPQQDGDLNEWTVMVKDSTGSFDGWYWADLGAPGHTPAPLKSHRGFANCAEAAYPSIGFGQYCINCHASAASGQGTFSTLKFLNTDAGGGTGPDPDRNIHHRLLHRAGSGDPTPAGCMIPESLDHVVAAGKPGGPKGFVTSDQCIGCHDATGTLSPTRADLPSMLFPDALAPSMVDLSPNGEWRNSMMGLAGRDPIFFSQLNSEVTLHPKLSDHTEDGKAVVEDTCLHCHGVMGQRQFHEDTGQLFTRDHLNDASSPYGALARDGVSCTVCHRIGSEGLGTAASFTGNFALDPPNQINGPYTDPKPVPMQQAMGMTPQATADKRIESSALCGSCHQIVLPVYDAKGNRIVRDGQPASFVEQSTFYEWQNSAFADNGSTPKSCQDCHMPRDFGSNTLSYKIANIEDSSFPAVDFRAPDADITMRPRAPYSRHLLLGINVFGLEMFKQFRNDLGLYAANPMLRDPEHTVAGFDQAIDAAVEIAQGTSTQASKVATVQVLGVEKAANVIHADVQITNLGGHNLPSGVGFRRAFVHFEVLDGSGKTLWQSGNTDANGAIVDGLGAPLKTEQFTPAQQQFQPHFWLNAPLTREDQVQIYEELVVNPEGLLTTSFLALDHKVKDNRLQPRGASPNGPHADELAAVGICTPDGQACDPNYADGSGSNVVSYVVPLNAQTASAAGVRATLYYQAIPPYYLQQRASDASGVDTDRLKFFTQNLQVAGTSIENWKLRIASVSQALP